MKHQKPLVCSFAPIADQRAKLLILGSMPGVASLAAQQYYAHPRNAFWPIMGALFGAGPELLYHERCDRLRAAGVAVWDVLRECRRDGSLDSSIDREDEVANDLVRLLRDCPRIEKVFFNGQKAETAFRKHISVGLEDPFHGRLTLTRLPSTSPAHAVRSFDEKLAAWRDALIGETGNAG